MTLWSTIKATWTATPERRGTQYTSPDGNAAVWVGNFARIDNGAYVGHGARVGDRAYVGPGASVPAIFLPFSKRRRL